MKKFFKWLVFTIGLALCLTPMVLNIIDQRKQAECITTYKKTVEGKDGGELKEILRSAREYNSMLYQSGGDSVGDMGSTILSTESYNANLNINGDGLMGSLEIPKIIVNLPIYHGTGDKELAIGVGHIQNTSLPVGGINTHSVLTGHRGLPSSKMLERLDELVKGDLFFLRMCDETLAYKVIEIKVVLPNNIKSMEIVPEKDLVSLVTCTPYGINTKRLIVTGTRVEYKKGDQAAIKSSIPSNRELLFTLLPFVLFTLFIINALIDRQSRKRREKMINAPIRAARRTYPGAAGK